MSFVALNLLVMVFKCFLSFFFRFQAKADGHIFKNQMLSKIPLVFLLMAGQQKNAISDLSVLKKKKKKKKKKKLQKHTQGRTERLEHIDIVLGTDCTGSIKVLFSQLIMKKRESVELKESVVSAKPESPITYKFTYATCNRQFNARSPS